MPLGNGMRNDPLFVGSLEKGMKVLQAFGSDSQYLSLSEIAAACGLDKSAAQRFTHTLHRLGYLEKCPRTRRFCLGKRLLDLSFFYLRANPLVEAATPALVELRRHCGEGVKLSLFDDLSVIYAVRQQSKREYFYAALVGRRMPTFCNAGGRAVLARLPPERVDGILARSRLDALTPKTVTDPDRIRAKIEEARAKGYAVAAEESMVGELVVAAAVTDAEGEPVAAVHIAGSTSEWTVEAFEQKFAPLAVETAGSLSRPRKLPGRTAAA